MYRQFIKKHIVAIRHKQKSLWELTRGFFFASKMRVHFACTILYFFCSSVVSQ